MNQTRRSGPTAAQNGSTSAAQPLSPAQLELIDAWWRAANYLSVGQIYLLDNPLLERPIEHADIKPRLLGHFGTTPGLNFIYVHLNRVIKARDLDVIYICGPGHGGPGMVANTWLEGTYSELYPSISQDVEGCADCSASSAFRAASRAMPPPIRRGRLTRGASSAIRCRTPMARPSTIPAWSPPV
jgi:xylulose-5-phosphate/fructose-6-phosphate phosphoketolase